MNTLSKSSSVFAEAKQYIPGGVNSPVRSFRSVGGNPPFITRGEGSKLYDLDGNNYIDYVLSYGPLLLGHAHPIVTEAVQEAAAKGTSFGAPTGAEVALAKLVCELVPSMDMVRMVNSGTEATMSAIRLARAYTGRDCIVKFIGCYHGHSDALLVHAGSGATTFGVPDSPGVTKGTAETTLSVPFNDLPALENVFAEKGKEIAAVIMEPTPGNMGLVLPKDGYLQAIRELTKKYGSLLIIDEVMSGFRSAQGGSQSLYHIEPDITCLGKVIGGGLPVAAYGGKREIMNWVSPVGPMYQAGTLSGNPLAMAAGIAALTYMKENDVCATLTKRNAELTDALKAAADAAGPAFRCRFPAWVPCSPCSSPRRKSPTTRTPPPAIWTPSASTSTACWNRASTCRLPSLRPISSPWPTATKISRRRQRQRKLHLRKWQKANSFIDVI